MKIETHVNLKNGKAIIFPNILNEFNGSFFKNIEQVKKDNGHIVLYGSNGEIPVKASEIRSFEFVILD